MSTTTATTTTDSEHACAIIWDAETVRDMHELSERATGHPCQGSVGGECPVLPRSLSSIAKQHADPRAVKAHAVKVYAEQLELAQERARRAAKSTMTPEETSQEISRVVSDALKAAGISQRRAAAQAGIPLSTLSRRLSGNGRPFLVTELFAMAKMLDTPVSTIAADAEAATA